MKAVLKLLPSCLFFFAFMPVCRAQQSPYLPPGEWDIYAGLNASQGLHKDAAHLFRGPGFSTEMGARYYFGRLGLSVAMGFVTGSADNGSVNDFIRERKYPRDQLRISKSDAVNDYLMIGPSFRFGGRFFVNADLRGGLMVNNPGMLDMTSTESGRSMYRFGGTDRSFFPGFSGDVSLNYAVSRSVRIFVHTAYLQSEASVSLIDVGGGLKEAVRVNRSMKVMSAGIGLTKIFHPGGTPGGNRRGVTRNPLYEQKGSAGENQLYEGGNRIAQNGPGLQRAVIRLGPDGAITGKLQAQDYNSTRSNKGYGLIVIDGNGIISGRMEAPDYNSTRSNKGYRLIRVGEDGKVTGKLEAQDYNSTRSNKGYGLIRVGKDGTITGLFSGEGYDSPAPGVSSGMILIGKNGAVTGMVEAQDYNSTRSNKGR